MYNKKSQIDASELGNKILVIMEKMEDITSDYSPHLEIENEHNGFSFRVADENGELIIDYTNDFDEIIRQLEKETKKKKVEEMLDDLDIDDLDEEKINKLYEILND